MEEKKYYYYIEKYLKDMLIYFTFNFIVHIYGIFESLRKHVEDRWYELIIISELENNYFAFRDCTLISNGFLSVIINIYMTASFFIWLFPQNVFQIWSILTDR